MNNGRENMIQDMLCKFNAYLEEMDASPASIKAYLCDLRKLIRWYEETTGVQPKTAAVIRLDIVEFRNYLERSARQQPATINRALTTYLDLKKENPTVSMVLSFCIY
jgi:site-specific recombinase XerD